MPALLHVPPLRRSIQTRTHDRCSPVETGQHASEACHASIGVQKTANLTHEA